VPVGAGVPARRRYDDLPTKRGDLQLLVRRLPAIQGDLDIGPGALGLALLGAPAGLVVAQPLVGALVARTGSRGIVAAAPAYLWAVILPAAAPDAGTLFVATALVGATNGTLHIAMNVQGLAVERATRRRIFNSLHAAFCFGALAGAGVAGPSPRSASRSFLI